MINHRGTRMKLSDYYQLRSPDHIRKNKNGELETQPFREYFDDISVGMMTLMDPEGFRRKMETDKKFREEQFAWYEKKKAVYSEEERLEKEIKKKC